MKDKLNYITDLLNNSKDLHDDLITTHPYDIAVVLSKLSVEERKNIYSALEIRYLADIFEYIEDNKEVLNYFEEMPKIKSAGILEKMERDDAADILKYDSKLADKYLRLLSNDAKSEITYLIGHNSDTAGSIMTTNYISIKKSYNVKAAMKSLINQATESEMIDPLFVVDDKGSLTGTINLKDLIVARAQEEISEIMDTNIISSNVTDDIVLASNKIHNYGLYALPILDNGILKGIITMDDALDTLDTEAKEDFEKLAAVGDIDEKLNFFHNFIKRFPWLILLLVLSFIVSIVMSGFNTIISRVTVLVFFQTLILDMAGNSGTQSLAVTVRGISKDEFESKTNILKNIFKEIKIGFLNALILSVLAFVSSYLFLTLNDNSENILFVSVIVGISLGLALMTSGVIGSIIPIILYKLKVDPAVASGPFITTLSDIIAVIIYFSLATCFLL